MIWNHRRVQDPNTESRPCDSLRDMKKLIANTEKAGEAYSV